MTLIFKIFFNLLFIFNIWAETINLPIGLHDNNEKTITIDFKKALLGKKLFNDKNLSKDKTISCSSCHNPESSFTINQAFAKGVFDRIGNVNPPVIFNRYKNGIQFWDGRSKNLSEQIIHPIFASNEMASSQQEIENYLNSKEEYIKDFKSSFSDLPKFNLATDAIIEYEKTILFGYSRYDLYQNGKKKSLNKEEIAGMNLFFNKFNCSSCHSGPNFTNENLEIRCYPKHFINLTDEEKRKVRKFKVPTLRNLSKSYPYLHDGSLSKLEEVIEFYTDTGIFNIQKNEISNIVNPTQKEKKQLVLFLKSLDEIKQKKGSH